MCRLYVAAVSTILLSLPPLAAPDKIEQQYHVSADFSSDEIAVYSFVFKSYRTLLKPTYRDMLAKGFYLDQETKLIDVSALKRRLSCLSGITFEGGSEGRISTVHNFFSQQRWLPSYVKPASIARCKLAAPSDICWESEATLSLSEIAFDKNHTHAVMAFEIGCGMQCGWGQTILLERVNGHWRRKGVCEEAYI